MGVVDSRGIRVLVMLVATWMLQAGRPTDSTAAAAVRVTPETVTVGMPFVVRVTVHAPRNSTVVFPDGPDSTKPIQALDPRVLTSSGNGDTTEFVAVYRLAAWNVGRQVVGLSDVMVRDNADSAAAPKTISLGDLSVVVRSVLPADSSERIPKGARAYLTDQGWTFPPWWVVALVGGGLLLFLIGLVWRRSRRGRRLLPADGYALAQQAFARARQAGLLDAGEYGQYIVLHVDIVRAYLAHRVGATAMAMTSSELQAIVQNDAKVPMNRLQALLAAGDAVKFAESNVTLDHAQWLAREAASFVEAVHAEAAGG